MGQYFTKVSNIETQELIEIICIKDKQENKPIKNEKLSHYPTQKSPETTLIWRF